MRSQANRFASFALFVHGCLTALILEAVLYQSHLPDLFKGMNLKLPMPTKVIVFISPLFSVPGIWLALSACWALLLVRLHRCELRAHAERSENLPQSSIDRLLACHVALCCVLLGVALSVVLPLYQLIGCLC